MKGKAKSGTFLQPLPCSDFLFSLHLRQQHRFVREGSAWFTDLPGFLAQGRRKADLQMVAGADVMLNIVAGEAGGVTLQPDTGTGPFAGADELILTGRCDPVLVGGYYHLGSFEGNAVAQDVWLCGVTGLVFGEIPERNLVKRVE